MRQLVLLRHATAEDGAARDFDRRLTPAGQEEARRMARWLVAQGLKPDHIRTSPALRALETAKLAAAEMGLLPAAVVVVGGLYECPSPEFLRRLADLPRRGRVLVVGHNPALEDVAVHLTGDEDLARRGLARAGVVAADLPDAWDDLGARCATRWVAADPATLR